MKPFCYHSFDLRQLVTFAEIARAGSFRQAAKTLHIAQPALNRQIKQLEAALGICLFDRAPRRLHLTIEGRELGTSSPATISESHPMAVGPSNPQGVRVSDFATFRFLCFISGLHQTMTASIARFLALLAGHPVHRRGSAALSLERRRE
jgi:DNA-binding MarR family transcriptional regulator